MESIVVRPRIAGSIVYLVLFGLLLTPAVLAPIGGQIVCAVIFVAALTFVVLRARRRITVDDVGIEHQRVFGTVRIAWDDVAYYTYWTAQALGDMSPKRGFCAINVAAKNRQRIVLDHRWRQPTDAVVRAIAAIHPRLRHADRVGFEPFTLGEHALRHKKTGGIAYTEIEKVVLSADQIGVRQAGKTISWQTVDIKHVTNSLLLLEALADRDVKVLTSGGQFLPPDVMRAIAAHRVNPATDQQ